MWIEGLNLPNDFLAVDVTVALEEVRAAGIMLVYRQAPAWGSTYKTGSLPKIMCQVYSIMLAVASSGRSLFMTQSYMRW